MTDHELQLYLAARLPERIVYDAKQKRVYWKPDKNGYPIQPSPVQDTEWDYIVRQVEQGLSDHNKRRFAFELTKQVFPGWSKHPSDCTELGLAWTGQFDMANASWQQRTQALIATLGEKKGEK